MRHENHSIGGFPTPRAGRAAPARRRVKVFCFLLCAVATVFPSAAATQDSLSALFANANAAYQKGDFPAAEQGYRDLLAKNVDSGVLYYNLGNACFKQKRLGEAIYFWEKAKRNLPGDPDVRENLELANLLVVDRIEIPPDPLPLRWLDSALHRLTIAQDSWCLLMLFVAANGLFALSLLARSPRLTYRALVSTFIVTFFFLLFGCSLAWKIYEKEHHREGVVVEQKSEVRSGPGAENIVVFTVHEGILLRIRGESSGWYQVSLPNGWSGWLQKNSVRVL